MPGNPVLQPALPAGAGVPPAGTGAHLLCGAAHDTLKRLGPAGVLPGWRLAGGGPLEIVPLLDLAGPDGGLPGGPSLEGRPRAVGVGPVGSALDHPAGLPGGGSLAGGGPAGHWVLPWMDMRPAAPGNAAGSDLVAT